MHAHIYPSIPFTPERLLCHDITYMLTPLDSSPRPILSPFDLFFLARGNSAAGVRIGGIDITTGSDVLFVLVIVVSGAKWPELSCLGGMKMKSM